MTMVPVNGWSFDCEITGEGPDIIFIHGEIHGKEYWEHQLKKFSKTHRCLTYNRRGHSTTGAPEYGYSLENQRRDLEALIKISLISSVSTGLSLNALIEDLERTASVTFISLTYFIQI